MASGQAALCRNAITLELERLSTIRPSPESVLTLETCLLDVYGMLRPRPCDYEQRASLVKAFNVLAKGTFGTLGHFPVVEAFGSFTMDLFAVGSDLDLSINLSDDYTTEVPRDQKISILRKFIRFLYTIERKGHISKILPVLRARVPVVKVVDSGTGIECDVSAENKDGVTRSSILTAIFSIDGRFRILSYLMKAWAKAHDINSSKDRTMNSLSIISLVAFHLQTRDPPILPPFSALLEDGNNASSVERIVVRFHNFGRRNEESIAELFVTLLIKLSAVESLWQQGLCVSTFEGAWIKKEWEAGIANMSIEDFLSRSENFARSVGQVGLKKIYGCVKDSLELLSRFMVGDVEEIKLKELLFETSTSNVSRVQPTKRPHEPDSVNPMTAKRPRYFEANETTSSGWPNPPIALDPSAALHVSHAENHMNLSDYSQLGFGPQYQPRPPILSPFDPANPVALFPPGHMENHVNPFEPFQPWQRPQSHIPPYLANVPQSESRYGIEHVDHRPQLHAQDPFTPQSSYGMEHHPDIFPDQFRSALGHHQPGRNLEFPEVMDGRWENPWVSRWDMRRQDAFFPPQQFNGPDYPFPPFPHQL